MKKTMYMHMLLLCSITFFIACNNIVQNKNPPHTQQQSEQKPPVKIPALLHGKYLGKMMGTFPVILTVTENITDFDNPRMPKTYTDMKCIDNKNGTWDILCYSENEKHVTVHINMNDNPPTATITIHPMGDAEIICKKKVDKDPGLDISGTILRGYTKAPGEPDLELLDIPDGITEIAEGAFNNSDGQYDKLAMIHFPESLKIINREAFNDCTGLSGNLKLPANLETIGLSAFSGCTALNEIVFPAKLTRIGEGAFSYCEGIEVLNFSASTNLEYIDKEAFINCTALKGALNLPANLKIIGEKAFYKCEKITGQLVLPAGIEAIKKSAFQRCTGITEVDLSGCTKLSQIDAGAFNHCTELTQVALPASLTKLENIFTGCTKLVNLSIDPANTSFSIKNNIVYNKAETELVLGAPAVTEAVAMPSTLIKIKNNAFVNNKALTKVRFPASLTEIENDAFSSCTELQEADFSACTNLTKIGSDAFNVCKKIREFNLTSCNNRLEIAQYAFNGCTTARFKVTAASGLKAKLKASGVNEALIEEN